MSDIENEQMMIDAAAQAIPREACGLVYKTRAYEIRNAAMNGTTFFIMDMEEQARLWQEFGNPDGVWHSHPNGDPNPSEADLHYHPPGARLYIVAGGKVHDHGVPGS